MRKKKRTTKRNQRIRDVGDLSNNLAIMNYAYKYFVGWEERERESKMAVRLEVYSGARSTEHCGRGSLGERRRSLIFGTTLRLNRCKLGAKSHFEGGVWYSVLRNWY